MITGYNTDVEHDGVVYHVQTEDKGLDTPFILSLVYSGGAILASKRSRYEDLIASGFSDEALSERLKRQHLLICAAIHAGRVLDLKRMAGADPELAVETPVAPVEIETPLQAQQEARASAGDSVTPEAAVPPVEPVTAPDAYTIHDPRRQSPLGEQAQEEEGLKISLLDEREFRSGDSLTLRIMVSQLSGKSEKPMNGAVVSVKVLGTAFRPMIYSMKTERDGTATVSARIPKFTSGRAAILIRALAGGSETELRRVIHAA
ncbi:MAG: hypothetical protein ND866_01890 [Pyrinomonadaceae bacterium]|nr:hypothetical protein [Pyrinomonadaceae bacterium]